MKEFFAATVFLLAATSAQALDGISAEIGAGTRQVDLWRFGAQWHQGLRMLEDTHFTMYWDATFGKWESNTGGLFELGLTPVFRYGREHGPYLDGGIGFHWLS